MVKETTMHIEPGVVNETKMLLSYATAGATGLTIKYASQTLRQRSVCFAFDDSNVIDCIFFEFLPKFPVGVQVHFAGSTFLLFGAAPAAIGLAAGHNRSDSVSSGPAAIFYEHSHCVVSVICDFMGWSRIILQSSLRGLHLHAGAETVSDLSNRHCWVAFWAFMARVWGGQHQRSDWVWS